MTVVAAVATEVAAATEVDPEVAATVVVMAATAVDLVEAATAVDPVAAEAATVEDPVAEAATVVVAAAVVRKDHLFSSETSRGQPTKKNLPTFLEVSDKLSNSAYFKTAKLANREVWASANMHQSRNANLLSTISMDMTFKVANFESITQNPETKVNLLLETDS